MKWKPRLSLAAALLLISTGLGHAQYLPGFQDSDGCQGYLPFAWVELGAGGLWEATVDLGQCAGEELGYFLYYGHINVNNRTRHIQVGDGILLTARNLSTGEEFTFRNGKNNDPFRVLSRTAAPCYFRLTAENTGRRSARVRMTWTHVDIQPSTQ